MMNSIWVNPQGSLGTGGGGEGGTPSSVHWSEIRDKPTEFKPEKHTHVIADIESLPEEIDGLKNLLAEHGEKITLIFEQSKNFVQKEEGKGLSSNDFTDELKRDLEELINSGGSGEGGSPVGNYVVSINGRDGEVVLSSADVNLSNVKNEEQATKIEFIELKEKVQNQEKTAIKTVNTKTPDLDGNISLSKYDIGLDNVLNETQATIDQLTETNDNIAKIHEEVDVKLEGKVDKVPGKGLSSNDFTDNEKAKLSAIQDFPESFVTTVNEQSGDVTIDKESLGLGKVLNEEQATKAEFESHKLLALEKLEVLNQNIDAKANKTDVDEQLVNKVSHTELTEGLMGKVDKKEGMGLSSNDFTDAHKEKLESLESGSGEGGETPSGDYVQSINGKTGIVTLTHEDLNIDKHFVSEEEFTVFKQETQLEHDTMNEAISNRVEKDGNKGLSTHDFTDEYKETLDSLSIPTDYVKTVNNKEPIDGNVTITKEDLGIKDGVSKELFETHTNDNTKHFEGQEKANLLADVENLKTTTQQNTAEISKKVNKREGYGLSQLDFTQALKSEYDENSLKLEQHLVADGKHLTDTDRENLDNFHNMSTEVVELRQGLNELNLTIQDHIEDNELHLQEGQRELLIELSTVPEQLNTHLENNAIHLTSEKNLLIGKIPSMETQVDMRPSYNKETKEFDEVLVANQETPLNQVAIRNMVIINQGDDISSIPDGTLVFVKAGE